MTTSWLKKCLYLFVCASALVAQDIAVSGIVMEKGTNEPLPGANIQLQGTTLGTSTGQDGRFDIVFKNRDRGTLVVSFVTYKDVVIDVDGSNSTDLKVYLEEDVFGSDEVVVTGLASTTKRANASNSVASVSAKNLTVVATPTLDGALSGKFAGVQVRQNSGAPGGGMSVKLRGVSTLLGNSEPLYVIDGNIISNAAINSGANVITKASSGGNSSSQDNPTNRIADLNMDDIERVEVLKGASAAAIYGAKAANGVILITTKMGKAGKTRINFKQSSGFNTISKKLEKKRIDGQPYYDHDEMVYGEEGSLNTSNLSVSGGNNTTNYFTSLSYKDDQGIVKNTGYEKYSLRLNFGHKFSDIFKIRLNSGLTKSKAKRGFTGNSNSNITYGYALASIPSNKDLRPVNGVYPSFDKTTNPLQTIDHAINDEDVLRSINSVNMELALFQDETQKMALNFTSGVDHYAQDNRVYTPTFLQYEQAKTGAGPGTNSLLKTTGTIFNINSNLIHNISLDADMSLATSAGFQYNYQRVNQLQLVAQNLIDGPTNVNLSADNSYNENNSLIKEAGFFGQTELNYMDMVNIAASMRGDASSTHGDVTKIHYYPKVSGSLRISEFSDWDKSILEEFKIRAAYGETGNSPIANAKYERLIIANQGSNMGAIASAQLGNPDIKPERVKEIELGLDGTLPSNLGTFELTYFNRVSEDLLLQQTLQASSGFATKYINGGEMEAHGYEATLNLNPVNTESVSWLSSINFSKNETKITKLTVPSFVAGGFGTSLGIFRIEEGQSATQIVGNLDTGGSGKLGDANPDFILSFSNEVKFGDFDLNFLLERKQGGDVINLTGLLYAGNLADEEWNKDLLLWATGNGTIPARAHTSAFVEDGSYWKLREVALNYTLNKETLDEWFNGAISTLKFGVSALNVFTITDYKGYNPDVSNFGNVAIGGSIDVTPFPSARSFYFNLSVGL